MPIFFEWYDQEQTLIYVRFEGKLTTEEYIGAEPGFLNLLQSVNHPVDVIIDPRKQSFFTSNYLETARRQHSLHYPNLRLVVFVGKTLAWDLFIVFARQFKFIPYRFMLANQLEEALKMIRDFRSEQAVAPPTSRARWN